MKSILAVGGMGKHQMISMIFFLNKNWLWRLEVNAKLHRKKFSIPIFLLKFKSFFNGVAKMFRQEHSFHKSM
jgi:hypothetical protein